MVNLLEGLTDFFGGFGLNSPESKSENNKKWYDFSFLEDEEEKSAFETAKKEAKSDTGLQLDDNVSSSYSSPLDTAKVKYGLNQTGYYDGDASTIPNQQMIDGVKEFQKDNNLHVDGILKPKGETITTMNGMLKDFYANKKYESGTEKGEKEYIKWALKQNEKEKTAALAPKSKPKPKHEDNWFSFKPLNKSAEKKESEFSSNSLLRQPESEPVKTPAEQLREEKSHEEKSLNLLESLQKKSVHDYSWLNDKAEKQTNVAASEDKYGIKSVDKAKRSEETSHSLLSFDIKRNERENRTIRNLLETKTKTDYPKPEDIRNEKRKITFDDIYYSKYDDKGGILYKNTDKHEGSFSNRENDLGGKTNYGITQFSLDEYHNWKSNKKTMHNLPKDVRQLSSEQAKNILDEMYYQKYELNKINNITILRNVFDEEVNQGTNAGIDLADIVNSFKGKSLPRSKIVSQELANIVNELNHNDTMKVNNLLSEKRMDRYFESVDRYPIQNINNLRGWYNRAKSYHTSPEYFEKLYKNKVDFYIQKKYPQYYNGK